jgi:hypothetical protein
MGEHKPGMKHVFKPIHLRLCRLELPVPIKKDTASDKENDTEKNIPLDLDSMLSGMTIAPLKEAYVILFRSDPHYLDGVCVSPELVLCRTDVNGTVFRIEENEIDDEPGKDKSKMYSFIDGKSYNYYWASNKDRFMEVLSAIKVNLSDAFQEYDFHEFHVSKAKGIKGSNLLSILKDRERRLMQNLIEYVLIGSTTTSPAVIRGEQIRRAGKQKKIKTKTDVYYVPDDSRIQIDNNSSYVFARSTGMDNYYLALLIHRIAQMEVSKYGSEVPVFQIMKHISHSTINADPIEELEEELRKTCMWPDEFRQYAYECAIEKEITRDEFKLTLRQGPTKNYTSGEWFDAAKKISEDHGIAHPTAYGPDTSEDLAFKPVPLAEEVILMYFDYYRFGYKNNWRANDIHEYEDVILTNSLTGIWSKISQFIENKVDYETLLMALSEHCYQDTEIKYGYHEGYLSLSLDVKYDWWAHFKVPGFQDKIKKIVKWIAGISAKTEISVKQKALDTILHKLWGAHFSNLDNAIKYNELLKNRMPRYEELFSGMLLTDETFGRTSLKRKIPNEPFTIEVDRAERTMKVFDSNGEKLTQIGDLEFTEIKKEIKVWHPNVEGKKLKKGKVRHKPRKPKMGKMLYELEPVMESHPHISTVDAVYFKNIHHWPSFAAAFGDAVALALTLASLGEQYRKNGILITIRLTGDIACVIDSSSGALVMLWHKYKWTNPGWLTKFRGVGEVAGKVATIITGAMNLYDGMTILLLKNDELKSASRRGQTLVVYGITIKGYALVTSVAFPLVLHGLAALGGAAAVAAVGGATCFQTMGVSLLVATFVIIGLEVFVYFTKGEATYVDHIYDDIDEKWILEFGQDWQLRNGRTYRELNKIKYWQGFDLVM